MKAGFKYFIFFLFLFSVCQISGCSPSPVETVLIKGSTTMAPLLERLAADYQKSGKIKIAIEATGSLVGISALIRKDCTIAASSVPVSAELIRKAEKNNVHLKAFPVCRDRIVPIVNTANPVSWLSISELKDIFTGQISNWKSSGGLNADIQIILRQTSSGTCRIWDRMILDSAPAAPGPILVASNSGVLAAVAENKHAIGYISNAYLNHEVKPIQLTDDDTITHLERSLLLYVDTHRMSREVKAFLTYLHSGPARQIITDSGFILITHI